MNADADPRTHWSVAEAKQRLSEVLRLAAREPQPIYNRGRLVAALVDAEAFAAFERWRREAGAQTVGAQFEALRAALAEGGTEAEPLQSPDALEAPLPESPRSDRSNAFAAMLDEEFPSPGGSAATGPGAKPGRPGQGAGRRAAGRGKR